MNTFSTIVWWELAVLFLSFGLVGYSSFGYVRNINLQEKIDVLLFSAFVFFSAYSMVQSIRFYFFTNEFVDISLNSINFSLQNGNVIIFTFFYTIILIVLALSYALQFLEKFLIEY